MRKILLVVIALTVVMTAFAQRKVTPGMRPALGGKNYYEVPVDKGTVPENAVINVPKAHTKSTSALNMVLIGASINVFGVLEEIQTPLWYEDALNAILMTCRGNQTGPTGVLATGNDINTFISTDKGLTFTGQTTLTRSGKLHRYPSGVFYNPDGNTDPANAFTVCAGPRTDAAGWIASYHGSANATAGDTAVTYILTSNTETVMNGMTACTNGTFNISGAWYTSDQLTHTVYWHQGVWNSSTLKPDWTVTPVEIGDYCMHRSDNTLLSYLGWGNTASARDGSIGYVLARGVDKDNTVHPSMAQILIKTTDGGQTFEHVPFFDWGTLPAIQEHIFPTAADPNVYAPYITGRDGGVTCDILVDMYGKPHIFAQIRGAYSINLDSLNYIWVGPDGFAADNNLFELYQDVSDNWHAVWIDSLVTEDLPDANSNWGGGSSSGAIGWTHRIQSSQTPDGSKIIVSWTESDYITWATEKYDFNPDLKIWGRDITTYLNTPVKNVTAEDPNLWGMAFFHFMAPTSWVEGSTVHIPITVEDIMTNNSPDLPVYHYYLPEVSFEMTDFVLGGQDLPSTAGNVNVTNCYPNPFSGTTSINVTLPKSSTVSIQVTSLTGQVISTSNCGTLAQGTHILKIDGSNLNAGVYFCTVTIGDQKSTQKLIVK